MASRRTYPCFACQKTGNEVFVYLDGKDEQGRTKYLNEDGTRHIHVGSSQQLLQQQQQQTQPQTQQGQAGSTTIVIQATQFDRMTAILNALTIKIDRVLALLEERRENKN
jgi:hypothetical protein